MSLSGWADLEEDNERLRDQIVDLETERDEMAATIVAQAAQINELRAQLEAKEEGATRHTELEQRDGYVWRRTVTVIAPEWEQLHEVGA